jgi:hypothetical protein
MRWVLGADGTKSSMLSTSGLFAMAVPGANAEKSEKSDLMLIYGVQVHPQVLVGGEFGIE